MFDFGFTELILIAVVALIVVGPERLPKVARTAGHLLGRLQRYVADVKSDISREMQLEDLKKLQQQVEQQARDLESSVRHQMRDVESDLGKTASQVSRDLSLDAGTPNGDTTAAQPALSEPASPVSEARRTPVDRSAGAAAGDTVHRGSAQGGGVQDAARSGPAPQRELETDHTATTRPPVGKS